MTPGIQPVACILMAIAAIAFFVAAFAGERFPRVGLVPLGLCALAIGLIVQFVTATHSWLLS